MPSKGAHQAATLLLAGAVYQGSGILGISSRDQLLVCSGVITGLAITPDHDLAENFASEPFWWLYGYLFKHRGISHKPILGTLTRVIYLALLIVPLFVAWGRWDLVVRFGQSKWLPVWLAGLMAADILHWGLDLTVSKFKGWIND
jgi:uncharacterized metal-binding protein